jgi:endonuclease VIII
MSRPSHACPAIREGRSCGSQFLLESFERHEPMPEGHTIHRAARDQRPMLVNQTVGLSSPQGRFTEGAMRLDETLCTAVEAFGKHLIYRFAHGLNLHIHLGLYGRIRTAKQPPDPPRGAVRVRLLSATHAVDINGPNTCEVLDEKGLAVLTGRIGPDVLRPDADPELAWKRIAGSRAPIGQLLMDQSVVAGIGNIYRSEILWRQKVHPETPGRSLDRATFDCIWADAVRLLGIGVENNAIITVEGAVKSRSKYGERVNIFDKPRCPACTADIRAFEIAARRVFMCEVCQTRP